MTQIEKASRTGPYKISFDDADTLVDYACADRDNPSVAILPFGRNVLTDGQRARLESAGKGVIYMETDGPPAADTLAPISSIIGIGRAYLNGDENAFYSLYEILTGVEEYQRSSLDALKANPSYFIERLHFILKPIMPRDMDELKELRRAVETLSVSA